MNAAAGGVPCPGAAASAPCLTLPPLAPGTRLRGRVSPRPLLSCSPLLNNPSSWVPLNTAGVGLPSQELGLAAPSQEPRAPLFSTFGDDEIPGGLAQPLLAPPKSQGPWLTAQGTCDLTDKLGWSRS